jgi:hypothetical protein
MITQRNPVTGDLLKTKTGNEEAYASGWDLIFSKKEFKLTVDTEEYLKEQNERA